MYFLSAIIENSFCVLDLLFPGISDNLNMQLFLFYYVFNCFNSLKEICMLTADDGGVGGNAADGDPFAGQLNFLKVCSIKQYFHKHNLYLSELIFFLCFWCQQEQR